MTLPSAPAAWSDYGAIAQSITAVASLVIALMAYLYSRRQTAINAALAINNAWNDINKFSIQEKISNEAFSLVAQPIHSGNAAEKFDQVIFMHLNIQEMYFYLRQNGAISRSSYRPILRDAGRMLARVPNLKQYLDRGYNPKFAASIEESVKNVVIVQKPNSQLAVTPQVESKN